MLDSIYGGITIAGWITLITIATIFTILLLTKWSTSYTFLGGITLLLVTGVLSSKEAFAGFSSSTVIVVALLFVLVTGLEKQGVLDWISEHCLGRPQRYITALIRLMIPVSLLSAFLSNTTVVAMFIGVVSKWSEKLAIPASKFLIPLSYASILGGVCTLIGTPPNLIITSMYQAETGQTIGFFDITPLGIICLAVGFATIILLQKLLPNRRSADESFNDVKAFSVELIVPTNSTYIGKSIKEAQLENVKGGHIIELHSFDGEVISPISGNEYLMGGDRLIYTGNVESILHLRESHGLAIASNQLFTKSGGDSKLRIVQVIVPENSRLVGCSFSQSDFETKYNLTLVAISRQGNCLNVSPRKVIILPGDLLLLECSEKFQLHATKTIKEVIFLEKGDQKEPYNAKTLLSGAIMVAVVLATAFNLLTLLESVLIGVFGMIFTRCCTVNEGQQTINWDVIIIFGCSLALGTALQNTGIAHLAALSLLKGVSNSPMLALGLIYLTASIMTEFVSNTAASALIFPISYSTALALGVNPMPFVMATMIACSSSFATPIGSPTHIMVYNPGGYRFSDFLKIGTIMNLVIMIVTLIVAPILWPF